MERSNLKKIVLNHYKFYPLFMEELRGLSVGSGIDYYSLLVQNFEADLCNVAAVSVEEREQLQIKMEEQKRKKPQDHCSDVLMIEDNGSFASGHNEDDNKFWLNSTFLVETKNWVAFTYASQLSGNAFAFSKRGLSVTMNSLFPNATYLDGAGQNFILRDILEAKDLNDAIARATKNFAMSGFSCNLGSIHKREVVNIEVGGRNVSVAHRGNTWKNGTIPHFNEYLRLHVAQSPDKSSDERLKRFREMRPTTTQGIVNFLGDFKDVNYPVYRTGTDGVYTLATQLVNFQNNSISIWNHKNPKSSNPDYHFKFGKHSTEE